MKDTWASVTTRIICLLDGVGSGGHSKMSPPTIQTRQSMATSKRLAAPQGLIKPQRGKVLARSAVSPLGHAGTAGREAYGTLWPHGEFSLGFRAKGQETDRVNASDGGWMDAIDAAGGTVPGWLSEAVAALDLPPVPNSHSEANRPETYGRNGITRYGSKMVKAGAYLLQERYGKGRLTFLTLTCPPMSDDAAKRVAGNWGDLVRQLLQWLTRRLESVGLPTKVVMVSEFQPKRAELGRLESLHIHAVFVGRKRSRGCWGITTEAMKGWWDKALDRVAGEPVAGTYWPYMKEVTSSAANYLGKYMSKGASNVARLGELWGWELIPRQWWAMTQDLRVSVKRACVKGCDVAEALDGIIDAYFKGSDPTFPGYLQAVHVDIAGAPVLVGYYGRLDDETAGELREWMSLSRGVVKRCVDK